MFDLLDPNTVKAVGTLVCFIALILLLDHIFRED